MEPYYYSKNLIWIASFQQTRRIIEATYLNCLSSINFVTFIATAVRIEAAWNIIIAMKKN